MNFNIFSLTRKKKKKQMNKIYVYIYIYIYIYTYSRGQFCYSVCILSIHYYGITTRTCLNLYFV